MEQNTITDSVKRIISAATNRSTEATIAGIRFRFCLDSTGLTVEHDRGWAHAPASMGIPECVEFLSAKLKAQLS